MSEQAQQPHTVERYTDWCHGCQECLSVFVCVPAALAFLESEGFCGTRAEAMSFITRCAVEASYGTFTMAWLSQRQWDRCRDGACCHNARLVGLKGCIVKEMI